MRFSKLSLIPLFILAASSISFSYADVLRCEKDIAAAKAEDHVLSYYTSVNGTGASLLSSTTTRLNKGFSSVGYDGLWSVYAEADRLDNGCYYDIYSDNTNYKVGTKHCGNYKVPGDCCNREHTVPQSWWGGGTSKQGCDAYMVLLSDGKINGDRSNHPYGETTTGKQLKMPADIETNRLGTSTNTSYVTGTVFEPMESRKGDLARVYFYAVAKWGAATFKSGEASSVFTTSGGTNGFVTSYLQMLLKWHNEDPVSEWEIQRNNKVESSQGNRNPFVDHPSWVDLIWGGTYNPANKNAEDTKGGKAVVKDGKLDPVIESKLSHIEVSNVKTNYVISDDFVEPTVTAYYENQTSREVSNAVFTGYDLSKAGNQTVSVSYTESNITKTTSYNIIVSEPTPVLLTGVDAYANKASLYVGETTSIVASVLPSNAYPRATISYVSDDDTIVSVNSKGVVVAIGEGQTNVSVVATQVGSSTLIRTTSVSFSVINKPIVEGAIKITRDSFTGSGSYTWGNWSEEGITGSGFIYLGNTTSIQMNGGKGSTCPTIYNDKELPGKITSVTVKTKSGNAGNMTLLLNKTAIQKEDVSGSVDFGTKEVNLNGVTWTIDSGNEYSYFSLKYSASSAMYIDSIEINYGQSGPVTKTLKYISVIEPKTEYYVGDDFVAPTVVAYYSDNTEQNVSASFTGYNMNDVGEQTVVAQYTYNQVTSQRSYTINVREKPSTPSKSGCGGNIVSTSIILSTFSLVGLTIIIYKKKRKYIN